MQVHREIHCVRGVKIIYPQGRAREARLLHSFNKSPTTTTKCSRAERAKARSVNHRLPSEAALAVVADLASRRHLNL